MTPVQIENMKASKRVLLTKGQLFWHYSIILLLMVSPAYTTVAAFKYYVTHSYTGKRSIQEMMWAGYPWLLPAVIAYFLQRRRLRFRTIHLKVTPAEFNAAVHETAQELEWEIETQTSGLLIATSGFSFRSWGERITIIRDKEKVLFNSICDPDNKPSAASFGMNRLNRRVFEKVLQTAINARQPMKP